MRLPPVKLTERINAEPAKVAKGKTKVGTGHRRSWTKSQFFRTVPKSVNTLAVGLATFAASALILLRGW